MAMWPMRASTGLEARPDRAIRNESFPPQAIIRQCRNLQADCRVTRRRPRQRARIAISLRGSSLAMKSRVLIHWTLALSCVASTCADAAGIRGTLTVASKPAKSRSGKAAAAALAARTAREAVVYLEEVPEKVEKRLRRDAEKQKEKNGMLRITQAKHRFHPRAVAVAPGTTVQFVNQDRVYHNVFSVSPAMRFDLGKYPPGQTRLLTFDKPGVVKLFCDIDPAMSGFVFIVPHHTFMHPDSAGGFE